MRYGLKSFLLTMELFEGGFLTAMQRWFMSICVRTGAEISLFSLLCRE